MTTFAKSARPGPTTAVAWCDRDGIYVEYPVKGGGPNYICRFPKTTDGLIAALNIIIANPITEGHTLTTKSHPAVRRPMPAASAEVKATAAEIVRKMLR